MIFLNALLLRNLPHVLSPWINDHWRTLADGSEEQETKDNAAQAPSTVSNQGVNKLSEEDQEEFYDSSSKEATPETIDDGGPEVAAIKDDQSDRYCHGCDSSYGYILNRRNYCRHCGDHFCASCCNQQVPRYFFGATAPAAKTETVTVCRRCFDYLSEKLEKQNTAEDGEKAVSKLQPGIN